MAKKFSKMSLLLWGGVLLAVLFFVFGVGRREGFGAIPCSNRIQQSSCVNAGCTWTPASCSNPEYSTSQNCSRVGATWTKGSCS